MTDIYAKYEKHYNVYYKNNLLGKLVKCLVSMERMEEEKSALVEKISELLLEVKSLREEKMAMELVLSEKENGSLSTKKFGSKVEEVIFLLSSLPKIEVDSKFKMSMILGLFGTKTDVSNDCGSRLGVIISNLTEDNGLLDKALFILRAKQDKAKEE